MKPKFFSVLIGIIIFLVYLHTIAPSVVEMDCAELATVQTILGIAHPTGYPLFTILGFLWLKIPLPFTTIFSLNLLATIYSVLAVVVFIQTSKLLLDNLSRFNSSWIKSQNISNKASYSNQLFQLVSFSRLGIKIKLKIIILLYSKKLRTSCNSSLIA